MDRRAFLTALGAGLLAAPLAAEAQPAGKVPRVGYVTSSGRSVNVEVFDQGLRDLGVRGLVLRLVPPGLEVEAHYFAFGRALPGWDDAPTAIVPSRWTRTRFRSRDISRLPLGDLARTKGIVDISVRKFG
jgi:hypothetical protein